jgi:HEPN domain-containing protein
MALSSKNTIPKSSTNYELAFYEAESFLTAAEAIAKKAQSVIFTENGMDKSIGLTYARHVNHSYAFELLLKCIMIIEDGHYFEGHDLLGLFGKLNPVTQAKITARFDEYKGIRRHRVYHGIFEKIELLSVLEEAGKAFIEFRYLFETKNKPYYNLDNALECLEHHISYLKPELKKL